MKKRCKTCQAEVYGGDAYCMKCGSQAAVKARQKQEKHHVIDATLATTTQSTLAQEIEPQSVLATLSQLRQRLFREIDATSADPGRSNAMIAIAKLSSEIIKCATVELEYDLRCQQAIHQRDLIALPSRDEVA